VFRGLALPLQPAASSKCPARDRFLALRDDARNRVERYADELGANAYAAFNAMTDLASHPPAIPHFRRSPHSLQAVAGAWAEEFGNLLATGSERFDFELYLGVHREIAAWD
jgi:hypothetical protein